MLHIAADFWNSANHWTIERMTVPEYEPTQWAISDRAFAERLRARIVNALFEIGRSADKAHKDADPAVKSDLRKRADAFYEAVKVAQGITL